MDAARDGSRRRSKETVVAVEYLPVIDALPAAFPDIATVAIDIPIGVPEDGQRQADIEAKKLLGKLESPVFRLRPAPHSRRRPMREPLRSQRR